MDDTHFQEFHHRMASVVVGALFQPLHQIMASVLAGLLVHLDRWQLAVVLTVDVVVGQLVWWVLVE